MAKMHLDDGVEIPEWANWLAQDEDGGWYAYENKPHCELNDIWSSNVRKGRFEFLYKDGYLEYVADWREQLYKLYWS